MPPIDIPVEVKHHFKMCIDNVRFLMFKVLNTAPKEHYTRIYDAFKQKLKRYICILLNWYKIYARNIPDALLMLIEQEQKINKLTYDKDKILQKLNYDIQCEIYHYMNRVYNLYPKR
jgi:hypothetical protein